MIFAARDTVFSIFLFGGFFLACTFVGGGFMLWSLSSHRRRLREIVDRYTAEHGFANQIVDEKMSPIAPLAYTLHSKNRKADWWVTLELSNGKAVILRIMDGEVTRFE